MNTLQCTELIDTKTEDIVLCGDDFTARAEADVCCKLVDILVNGESHAYLNDCNLNELTLHNITNDKLIQFVYKPRKFSIDVVSNDNGSHNIVVDGLNVIEKGKEDEVVIQCGQNMQTECIPDDCYTLDYSITTLTSTDVTEDGCNYNIEINQQFLLDNNVLKLN